MHTDRPLDFAHTQAFFAAIIFGWGIGMLVYIPLLLTAVPGIPTDAEVVVVRTMAMFHWRAAKEVLFLAAAMWTPIIACTCGLVLGYTEARFPLSRREWTIGALLGFSVGVITAMILTGLQSNWVI